MSESHPPQIRLDRISQRTALIHRLKKENRHDLAARLAKCGQPLTLRCIACTAPRECFTRCDLKWCPSCQYALAARTAERYKKIMHAIKWPLTATLTAQNFAYDESDAVRQIRRAWGRLRRLRWFRTRVRGGVTAFEVTDTGNGFHVHAHALFDCRWFAVGTSPPRVGSTREIWKAAGRSAALEVAEQWSLCCRRPASMRVRRVWSRDAGDISAALAETLKYATKGSDLADETKARSASAIIDQIDRCRMVTSFGSCFGLPEFKRTRAAPAMCGCGCSDWLPETVMAETEFRAARKRR